MESDAYARDLGRLNYRRTQSAVLANKHLKDLEVPGNKHSKDWPFATQRAVVSDQGYSPRYTVRNLASIPSLPLPRHQ
jgi:hypothetical protein